MDAKQLKIHLSGDVASIIFILEEIKCHHIKHIKGKRIMCALPDGDNTSSVIVTLDEDLTTFVNTRSDYSGGSVIDFVGYILKLDFRQSYLYICDKLNISTDFKYIKTKQNETYSFLNKFVGKKLRENDKSNADFNTILNENIFNSFVQFPHTKLLQDGCSIDSQIKFEIMYDINDSRILFPIRDELGNLVTIKGRTIHENYKEKNIPKFLAYHEYAGRLILYGLYQNYWDILSNEQIYIVESEKAVIQADTFGVNNIVGISKKKLANEQIDILIKLKKDLIFALDKDVELDDIIKIAEPFKNLCKIYAMIDDFGLLKEKDSPLDNGYETFKILSENKIQIY